MAAPVPLTRFSPGGGCACKLPQRLLDDVLGSLRAAAAPGGTDARLRVGLDPADDAAVYDLPGWEGRSLVVTCDFLTPVVDDAYDWGRIAAANALSDVYAMGGRPLLALNLLAWPSELGPGPVGDVLRGGSDAVTEAGAVLAGGHSIVDPAPKYGLAVVGEVERHQILRKGGGCPGDLLVLTKPLGVGVVGTAVKQGRASGPDVAGAVAVMTRLNASASRAAVTHGLTGGTDVTGYGLIGHLHEMAMAAGLEAVVRPRSVPVLPGAARLAAQGAAPDGSRRTLRDAVDAGWFVPGDTDPVRQLLLADAQTSGGLLLAVPPAREEELLAALRSGGDTASSVVGELTAGTAGRVTTAPGPVGRNG